MPRFLDTNIMLRHLLNDQPAMAQASRHLFDDLEHGRAEAWTTDLAIAEVVFVLSGRRTYNLPRAAIRSGLLPIIELPGLHLATKRLYPRTFDLWTSFPIDFPDAFHAALVERRKPPELYSFDTDFDRIPTIRRVEP